MTDDLSYPFVIINNISAFLRSLVLHKEFFNAGPQSETLNKEDIHTKETTEIYRNADGINKYGAKIQYFIRTLQHT